MHWRANRCRYGQDEQIWDWLYVEDHARALVQVITRGQPGETYNIGGHNEKTNLEVVCEICRILDELVPHSAGGATLDAQRVTENAG